MQERPPVLAAAPIVLEGDGHGGGHGGGHSDPDGAEKDDH